MKNVFRMIGIIAVIGSLLAVGCSSSPKAAAGGKKLDQAIAEAAARIDADIQTGTKIALLNFSSPSDQFSSYVLDELTANLLDTKKLTVVDRKEVDLIRSEFNFQFSGEVGDDSIQELGRMLGAQSIVSGSLTKIGDDYRIVIRVLNVQSAAVAVQYRSDIANDSRVKALLEGGRSSGTTTAAASGARTGTTGGAAASGTNAASGSRQAAQTQPAGLKNGTYSFFPRLQATQSGVKRDYYIAQIIVSSDYIVIYFSPRAIGDFNKPTIGNSKGAKDFIAQDLDSPTRFYTAVNTEHASGLVSVTVSSVSFRRFPAAKFKLTVGESSEPLIWGEIDLSKAEYEP